MRSRFAAVPVIVLSLALATSSSVLAQEASGDPSPEQRKPDSSALEVLCAANAPDDASLQVCVDVVRGILAPDGEPISIDGPDLADRVAALVDEAAQMADGIDVQGAIDDAAETLEDIDVDAIVEELRASVEDLDVQALVDEAVTSGQEVDLSAVIGEAIASAQDVDVQELVDDVVSDLQETEVMTTIEAGITETRGVIDAAQTFVEENPELVCDTSSVGLGVSAGAVVGFLTDSPGLALVAYREVQKATDGACGAGVD